MGSYLSKPKTRKVSEEGGNGTLSFACSAMQGWRTSMEDAHVVSLDLDEETHFFGVFDGHGGASVAKYCAKHLPGHLLKSPHYPAPGTGQGGSSKGDWERALQDAFLSVDPILSTPAGRRQLAQYENEANTEEAELYGYSSAEEGSDGDGNEDADDHIEANDNQAVLTDEVREAMTSVIAATEFIKKIQRGAAATEADASAEVGCQSSASDPTPCEADNKGAKRVAKKRARCATDADGTGRVTDGTGDKADSGACVRKRSKSVYLPGRKRLCRQPKAEEDDDDDNDDNDDDDDDDDDDDEQTEEGGSEDGDDDGNGEEPMAAVDGRAGRRGIEMGVGCTAVVAVLRGDLLVTANAGDSRAVLSRAGKAFPLSDDHKPLNPGERARIEKAGGHVTEDEGRVNGDLNLSRSIGDCRFKRSTWLPPQEQQVTAFPDVTKVVLKPGDDFMVLACDGIWDVKTNQEVVNFLRERGSSIGIDGQAVDTIDTPPGHASKRAVEELLDACISPDPEMNDGLGCDNMSVVAVSLARYVRRLNKASPEQGNLSSSS